MDYKTDLEHALYLADTADKIGKKYYLSGSLRVVTKPDNTPVTQADLEAERALSDIVTSQFNECYLGEEGTRLGKGNRLWVVDPIDGTKNFMRGVPIWANLIALIDNGITVAAVVSAPALGRRWWASKGDGAWTKDVDTTVRKLQVSGVEAVSDAFILTSTLHSWDQVPTGLDSVLQLIKQCGRERAIGDFFGHMLVAEGASDICIEPNLKLWDYAAPALIVSEAGGKLWTNTTDKTAPEAPRIVITTNGILEATVRKALKV